MKIKSARYFRQRYHNDTRGFKEGSGYDVDFIGSSFITPTEERVKGFFDLYHGDKESIDGLLSTFLKIAEDGQAIYEFLQNAADCGSSLFYLFYDERYLIAVNNGEVFNKNGLRSILNISQSVKQSASEIGRFGIGFKLVHRLVGKGDGKDELIKDLKGPIMFSWSKKSDLLALMDGEAIEPVNDISDSSDLPYLLKLILTNFPAGPNETVKNLQYEDAVLFTQEEYVEMGSKIKEYLSPYIDQDNFNQGSIFFIRLGEGKKELLDKDYDENFKTGVEYSLNTLKGLKNVKVNSNQLLEAPLALETGEIAQDTEEFNRISPEYKDAPIRFAIGYNKIDFGAEKPFRGVEHLKESPTFYKYFPLGDETHCSALFVHCDSISNQANRRKLQDDSVNKELLPEIARFIIQKLDEYRDTNNRTAFLQLFTSILLCGEVPSNSAWVKEYFYDILLDYIKVNIPIADGYCDTGMNVKIRKIKCNIPLEIANENYRWFEWTDEVETLRPILDAAKAKLGVKGYTIVDFISNADIEKLNMWIKNADNASYAVFMEELNSRSLYEIKDKIRAIKLFKFSDGEFYSYNDIVTSQYNYNSRRTEFLYRTNPVCIFSTTKTVEFFAELKKLGFVLSDENIDKYDRIKERFDIPSDTHVFDRISDKLNPNTLTRDEKKNLIQHFATTDENIKFTGIGESSIKKLCLCRNNSGEYVCLEKLLSRSYDVPVWLNLNQIHSEDYFPELDKYLMPEKDIYREIVYKQWDDIKPIENVEMFYEKVKYLYELDAENNKELASKEYIFSENGEYVSQSDIFFNDSLTNHSLKYANLQNAVSTIFGLTLPKKSILSYLSVAPFGTTHDLLTDCGIETDAKSINKEDVHSLIQVCTLHNEAFFSSFVIEGVDGGYNVLEKSEECFQVYTANKATREFIKTYCADTMHLLPAAFADYKNSEGIVSGESLHEQILSCVEDVDEQKELLIDIVSGDARKTFLNMLSSVTINLDAEADTDGFEYKILSLASKILKENECRDFYEKLVFVKNEEEYTYTDFPETVADSFTVEGGKQPFAISAILPNENQNAAILNEAVDVFSNLGIDREKLKNLLGITSEADVDAIFQSLQEKYPVLQNAQQLAFVLLMLAKDSKPNDSINLIAADGEEYKGLFYFIDKLFIDKAYLLDNRYEGVENFMDIPKSGSVVKQPYISDGKFQSDGISTKDAEDNIDFAKVKSLLDFLKTLYLSDKDSFESVDWDNLKDILGFTPSECIFPSQFTLDCEKLPEEIEDWCKLEDRNKDTLKAMGLLAEDSVIVEMRKALIHVGTNTFDVGKVSACDYKDDLEHSLEWLNENGQFPLNETDYEIVSATVNRINILRGNSGEIKITDEYDLEKLSDESIQYGEEGYKEWKEETEISIYLYDGTLPKNITIDEYIDKVIYTYNDGDVCDDVDATIYVNSAEDLQNLLHRHATDNEIGLTTELVYKLFNRNISDLQQQIEKLKKENECLRSNLPVPKDEVNMKGQTRNDVDRDERPEYNEIARKKVKKFLEPQGFSFTQGIGDCSIVYGVLDPERKNRPLVVKSCRWGRLYLNPMEWGVLLRPDAMLWVFDGHDVMPLHLRALIMGQDKLVLTMDTTNLDDVNKVSKFAQILQYFKQVNFEFNSVRPTTIASTYKEYAFDDRPKDEKLSVDNFE